MFVYHICIYVDLNPTILLKDAPFFESLAKNNARCTSLFSFVNVYIYNYVIQDSDSVA